MRRWLNQETDLSTCSILTEETQDQVEQLLKSPKGTEFTLEKDRFISPAKSGFDGFYMARMIRS